MLQIGESRAQTAVNSSRRGWWFTQGIKNRKQNRLYKRSLNPNINLQILLSVLQIFVMVQVGRIHLNIKPIYLW